MPQPYPYHYAKKFAKPREHEQKTILIAGVTQRPDIRKGQLVAKELQKLFPELASTPATPVITLVELGKKLLTNQGYYDKTVLEAQEKLKKYDYEESATRLMALVNAHKNA